MLEYMCLCVWIQFLFSYCKKVHHVYSKISLTAIISNIFYYSSSIMCAAGKDPLFEINVSSTKLLYTPGSQINTLEDGKSVDKLGGFL